MKLKVIFLFNLLGLLPMTVMAQAEKAQDVRTFSVYLENDTFAGTDELYTSGTKLTWISPDLMNYQEDSRLPTWSYPLIKWLPFVKKPGFQRAISISIGQNIYTPEDIERSDLIEEDQPYAGIAYFAIGFQSKNSRQMDTLEFDMGVVGPRSYAEESQRFVHKWINSDHPKGWDNQLKNEPTLDVIYMRKRKLLQSGVGSDFGYDVIPHVGARLGNVFTYANAGTQVRFGWNLPNDFGTFLIRPGCECNAPLDERDPRLFPRERFGIHVFAAVDAHAVLRDISLDGNTFRDSHRVDKEHLTANLMAGLGLTVGRFKISYAYVYQTKKFKAQKDEHIFGTITVSFSY